MAQGEVYLGGPLRALSDGGFPERFPEFARPEDTRRLFAERQWRTVAAFQTRNPIHRAHEYLIRIALEISDGVLIHPVVGALKPGDIPAEVRILCYRALLGRYLPETRIALAVYPMDMRYAGPREAVLHAIIRQNFGCSHMIIGRDHAGVGKYYGPFDAQQIFDQLRPGDLAIRPLNLDMTFWCYACGGVASRKSCPHAEVHHCVISGTELRERLRRGDRVPAVFSRPEVLSILQDYYRQGGNA
jgi:sulfate adenylyltransferase